MCAESKEEIDSCLNLYHVMYALSALAARFQKYCEFNLRIRETQADVTPKIKARYVIIDLPINLIETNVLLKIK